LIFSFISFIGCTDFLCFVVVFGGFLFCSVSVVLFFVSSFPSALLCHSFFL
jgi:hypothetical protein